MTASTPTKTWVDEPVVVDFGFDQRQTSPLGKLIAEGRDEEIQQRLQQPIDWGYEQTEALESAFRTGRFAESLITAGSPITPQVLYMAYHFGPRAVFWQLAHTHPEHIRSTPAESMLLDAAREQDQSAVALVLTRGHDFNCDARDYYYGFPGWTALHHACHNSLPEMVDMLIKAGSDVNITTEAGETPLILCTKNSYKKTVTRQSRKACIRLLLNAGAAFSAHSNPLSRFFLRYGIVW